MSATDELRRLLDERGAEWREWTKTGGHGYSNVETEWFVPYNSVGLDVPGGFFAKARNSANGLLYLTSLVASPEQAIAATLGDYYRKDS